MRKSKWNWEGSLVAELYHQQLCLMSAECRGIFLGLQKFFPTTRETTIVVSCHQTAFTNWLRTLQRSDARPRWVKWQRFDTLSSKTTKVSSESHSPWELKNSFDGHAKWEAGTVPLLQYHMELQYKAHEVKQTGDSHQQVAFRNKKARETSPM